MMQVLSWWLAITLGMAAATAWTPSSIADDGTVEFLTVGPEEGEHWSTVWFVVIDDAVYFRLGPRAAKRIEQNKTAPLLDLRSKDGQVRRMRYEVVPEKFDAVAQAMSEKYWTDVFGEPFRRLGLTSPTMTLRLAPATD